MADSKKTRKNPFLDPEHPVTRFLETLANLMWVNILTIALIIPVITAGASLCAMSGCLMAMAEGNGDGITKRFFHTFRSCFGDATMLWLIYLAVICVEAGAAALSAMGYFTLGAPAIAVMIVVGVLFFASGIYSFALVARYENTTGKTFANSFRLAIGYLPMSLCMVAAFALLDYFFYKTWPYTGALIILFGITLPAYLSIREVLKIFRKSTKDDSDEDEQ